uniref:Uncharacterized protein n=1 Tax=Oncorhynchus kisutch TaxID=8019 RepID=A0A8C7FWC5_ONCKI
MHLSSFLSLIAKGLNTYVNKVFLFFNFNTFFADVFCTVCSFAPDLTVCFSTNLFVLKHSGNYEKVVVQLTNGIAVCGQPQQLLQQTLPPPVFQMLLTMLLTIKYLSPILLPMGGVIEENLQNQLPKCLFVTQISTMVSQIQ